MNGSVTIHYSIPMPPGGNGKKVGSETLPLNGDQWPMETPSPTWQRSSPAIHTPPKTRSRAPLGWNNTHRPPTGMPQKAL